jgi:hypothetical protein
MPLTAFHVAKEWFADTRHICQGMLAQFAIFTPCFDGLSAIKFGIENVGRNASSVVRRLGCFIKSNIVQALVRRRRVFKKSIGTIVFALAVLFYYNNPAHLRTPRLGSFSPGMSRRATGVILSSCVVQNGQIH